MRSSWQNFCEICGKMIGLGYTHCYKHKPKMGEFSKNQNPKKRGQSVGIERSFKDV